MKVMYLFAGRKRHSDVAAFLRQAVAKGHIRLLIKEFDIERSPNHDLTDISLWDEILETLKQGGWCIIVSPPCNTFSRARFQHRSFPGPKPLRTKAWPKGFPWLSNIHKQKVSEANFFVEKCLEACDCAASSEGFFILEHPEDLGTVQGEQPGSIWQWQEVLDLIPKWSASCFAIHQCKFGALTPKPTRLLTNMEVQDNRCFMSLPKFDKFGFYKGPLPRKCGHSHTHKLIGKTGSRWNTSPSAAYPPGMCEFLARLILNAVASFGRGLGSNKSGKKGLKRSSNAGEISCKRQRLGESPSLQVSASKVSEASVSKVSSPQGTGALNSSKLDKLSTHTKSGLPSDKLSSHTRSGFTGNDVLGDSSSGRLDSHQTAPFAEDTCDRADDSEEQFDVMACYNSGMPIQVEWDQTTRGFVDGFGLCSPTRWRPQQRGERRTAEMVKLAGATFNLLLDCVNKCIGDVRKEAFKLVTGKITESPFSQQALADLREGWVSLLPDPADARVVDDGQPFFLRALSPVVEEV